MASDQVLTTLIIAFFASLAPTIAAVASLMIAIRNGSKSDRIIATTGEIHTATNGRLTRLQVDLAIARAQIEQLQVILSDSGVIKPTGPPNV